MSILKIARERMDRAFLHAWCTCVRDPNYTPIRRRSIPTQDAPSLLAGTLKRHPLGRGSSWMAFLCLHEERVLNSLEVRYSA